MTLSERSLFTSLALTALLALGGSSAVPGGGTKPVEAPAPLVDAHVHVLSPRGAARMRAALGDDGALEAVSRGADQVLAMMDSAGVRRALIISDGYEFGSQELAAPGEEAAVRAENDWVAQQVARAPGRLVGFCSVDPLRSYALAEVERCARALHLSGLKLHFTGAGADLRDPAHVARLRTVFAEADRLRLPILVHVRTWRADYGAGDARIFVEQVLPAAPHVPIQVAHLGGWGGYDAATDEALAAFVDALRHGSLRGRPIFFDLAMVAGAPPALRTGPAGTRADANRAERADSLLVRRLRELGPEHVVFGSDWPLGCSLSYATDVRAALAGDPALFAEILRTVPPYLVEAAMVRR